MYATEAYKQLNDELGCTRSNWERMQKVKSQYHLELMEWRNSGLLKQDEYLYMKNDFPETPVTYILPKMHKDPAQPRERPIISAN